MRPIRFDKLGMVPALRRKTDYKRWSDASNLHPSWEPRTERAAQLVPKNSRVIEFGAGNRVLERFLDPSCTYVPSDLVDRGPGTIVCDLNQRPLPDLDRNAYDVAVVMGVFEYLRDVPSVVDWLTGLVSCCVVSYGCPDANAGSRRTALGGVDRISRGWMNTYTQDELQDLFAKHGFRTAHTETWANADGYQHRLFVFTNSPDSEESA